MVRSPFRLRKLPCPPLPSELSWIWAKISVTRILVILLMYLTSGLGPALPGEAAEVPVRLNAFSEGGAVIKKVKSMKELRLRQVVPQTLDYSCGAAALATLLRYHFGHQVTETDAILGMFKHGEQEKIRRRGFSMLDMKKYALRKGLKAKGYRVEDLDLLKQVNIPVITLIETNRYKHFVVIRGVDDRFVYLSDPSWGNRKMALADFRKYWNRAILAFFGPCQGTPEGLFCEDGKKYLPKYQAFRYEALLGHRFAMDAANTMIYVTHFPDQTSIPVLIQPVVGFLSGN
jgi:uncharacterized protein